MNVYDLHVVVLSCAHRTFSSLRDREAKKKRRHTFTFFAIQMERLSKILYAQAGGGRDSGERAREEDTECLN